MKQLYENLGFTQNPFSRGSAEEELPYLKNIYVNPRYFATLFSDLSTGSSRYVFGTRGSGKSALTYQMLGELQAKGVLAILIDDYVGVPKSKNEKDLIHSTIQRIVKELALVLSMQKQMVEKLSFAEKEKLAFVFKEYFTSLSKTDYNDQIEKFHKIRTKNTLKKLFNSILNKPVNYFISGVVEAGSDIVRKALGLPNVDTKEFYKTYVPELKLEKVIPSGAKDFDYSFQRNVLIDLAGLVRSLGFSNMVIFFDKIDEYRILGNKIDDITSFVLPILNDTSLVLHQKFSLVFVLWNDLKDSLNQAGVRFDKLHPIDVSWDEGEIRKIASRRLQHFSASNIITLEALLPADCDIGLVFRLSNRSPRDFLRLMRAVYDEQSALDVEAKRVSADAVTRGLNSFCLNYDYYSLYPARRGTREDIRSIINKLLAMKKTTFTIAEMAAHFKVSKATGISHIKVMKNYGVVKERDDIMSQENVYTILDPKIIYMIDKGVAGI